MISADGEVHRYHEPIAITGEGAPSIVHIDGARYSLYRYSLFGIRGRVYGFIASMDAPTKDQCSRAAAELFGRPISGILKLDRMDTLDQSAS